MLLHFDELHFLLLTLIQFNFFFEKLLLHSLLELGEVVGVAFQFIWFIVYFTVNHNRVVFFGERSF
jgi:hypothetical protein